MPMKTTLSSTLALLLLISIPTASWSQTEEECRQRVMNSMENAGKLGGTETDQFKWAQHAANECYKEASGKTSRSRDSDSSSSSDSRDSFLKRDGTQIFIFSVALALFFWFALGKHVLKIGRMLVLKKRLEGMSPAERQKFFENNPNL